MAVRNLIQRLSAAWHERTLVLKAASFAAVGVANFLVDFGVFWVAVRYAGVPLVIANVLAWLVAVTFSYAMNSSITFVRESGGRLNWRAYLKFAGSGVAGLIANTATLLLALRVLPPFVADADHQLAAAKACAILASFLVNFALSYLVVFRRRG